MQSILNNAVIYFAGLGTNPKDIFLQNLSCLELYSFCIVTDFTMRGTIDQPKYCRIDSKPIIRSLQV